MAAKRTVSFKIYALATLLLALAIAIGVGGYCSLTAVVDRGAKAAAVAVVDDGITEARSMEKTYRLDGSASSLAALDQQLQGLRGEVQQARNGLTDPANQQQMDQVLACVVRYGQAADRYAARNANRTQAIATMRADAGKVLQAAEEVQQAQREALAALRQTTTQRLQRQQAVQELAADAEVAYLKARKSEKETLLTKGADPGYLRRAGEELDLTAATLRQLHDLAATPEERQRLTASLQRLDGYRQSYTALVAALQQNQDTTAVLAAIRKDSAELLELLEATGHAAQQDVAAAQQASERSTGELLQRFDLATTLVETYLEAEKGLFEFVATRDRQCQERVAHDLEAVAAALVRLAGMVQDPASTQSVARLQQLVAGYRQEFADYGKAVDDQRLAEQDLEKEASAVVSLCDAASKDQERRLAAETAAATTFLVSLIATAAVLAAALSWLLVRGITGPLNRIIHGLSQGAEQVASASEEVSSASQHLASGASEQAASIQETSSALQQMTGNAKANAERARKADGLARNATDKATSGEKRATEVSARVGEKMQDLKQSIDAIQKSTEATARIVDTIDEIAFQTNLLALNAAVEAARAGEAGMGFAIVADEVRNLAQRSANEVKNTSQLMQEARVNTERVQEVAGEVEKFLNDAVSTEIVGIFRDTVTTANQVADLMTEVTSASDQQASGVEQINVAVSQMQQVTANNAASAEESAAASEELSSQSVETLRVVSELEAMVHGTARRREPPTKSTATARAR